MICMSELQLVGIIASALCVGLGLMYVATRPVYTKGGA